MRITQLHPRLRFSLEEQPGTTSNPAESRWEFTARRLRIAEPRVNGYIRAKEVRVVAPDGEQIGVKSTQEALWLAEQLNMDLVEVAPNAKPPVARLMDYGKYKYEQSVKEREARKKQSRSTIKEITFRVKIGDHDYEIKRKRAARFLDDGDKVRVRIWFRGREAAKPELGTRILDRLADDLVRHGNVEQSAKQEGRNMTMTFVPLKESERAAFAEDDAEDEEVAEAAAPQSAAPAEAETTAAPAEATAPESDNPDPDEPAPDEAADTDE